MHDMKGHSHGAVRSSSLGARHDATHLRFAQSGAGASHGRATTSAKTTLWLDCFAGMSGDMLLGALLDLGAAKAELDGLVERLAFPGVRVDVSDVRRAGMRASFARVVIPDEHAHRHLKDVLALVDKAVLAPRARERAHAVFTRLAAAEARVHGIAIDEVHFHEVGAVDAIVDVAGAATLLESLAVDRVTASPVRTGFGSVRAAHGEMPVPTPATALLLQGLPSFGGDVTGEACTPTGAALLAALVDAWGPQPFGVIAGIGTGAGGRDPKAHANVVRAILVDTSAGAPDARPWIDETLAEIECHIDDMSGEALGFLSEELLRGPAKDVVFTPVTGKKSRPAVLVRVLVEVAATDAALALLFTHSTTLGARVLDARRVRLPREEIVIETPLGRARAKRVTFGDRVRVFPEYDDVAAIARAHGLSFADAEARVMAFFGAP
jgi:uncharacterized protein (TIGR00299 family) protein